jgi:hypothetical protein
MRTEIRVKAVTHENEKYRNKGIGAGLKQMRREEIILKAATPSINGYLVNRFQVVSPDPCSL